MIIINKINQDIKDLIPKNNIYYIIIKKYNHMAEEDSFNMQSLKKILHEMQKNLIDKQKNHKRI